MQITNPVGQRRINLSGLARTIWKHPGISRRELLERFDIDESSVSRLVGQLIGLGLVESVGAIEGSTAPGPAPGGRKRIALRIKADFGQVWGLTLWLDRVLVTIVDVQGGPLATGEYRLESYDGDWGAYLDRAIAHASALAGTLREDLPLLGIGFGFPGWVDSENSVIVNSEEFRMKERPCPRAWHPDLPVLWENDANCGAWSGLGASAPANDEVFVLGRFLEHGPMGFPSEFSVGFGLVKGGQIHRGWRHNVGEFISALWRPGNTSAYGVDDATYGTCRSDPEAFLATISDLMRNLRFLAGILDPSAIHLGGDLKSRFDAVLQACSRIGWPAAAELLHPLPAGVDEVSLGAALLVLDELFRPTPGKGRTLFRDSGTAAPELWRGIPVPSV